MGIRRTSTTIIEYTYDVFDRRISKSVNSTTTDSFVYNGADVLLVYDGAGSLKTAYFHGPATDQVLAAEDAAAGEVYWYFADNLGTVRDVATYDDVTGTATVVNHIVYNAYGRIVDQTPGTPHEPVYAFTGREWDEDAGLYYYRARWYDADLGRFISEDPIGFAAGDANLSRYVGNSPTNYTDPSGLEASDARFMNVEGLRIFVGDRGSNYDHNDAHLIVPGLTEADAQTLIGLLSNAAFVSRELNALDSKIAKLDAARSHSNFVFKRTLEKSEEQLEAERLRSGVWATLQRIQMAYAAAGFEEYSVIGTGPEIKPDNSRSQYGGRGFHNALQGFIQARRPRTCGSGGGLGFAVSPLDVAAAAAAVAYAGTARVVATTVAVEATETAIEEVTNVPIGMVNLARASRFGGVVANTAEEATFLRNAAATFGDSSAYSSARRFSANIVIQRSDIPFSVQNVRRMADGNTPFVRNQLGEWEKLNLHHVGRQDGKLIEVLSSHNTYNPTTGGPLHIPGPGNPVRDSTLAQDYWKQRLQDAIEAGQVPENVLREAGF